MTVLGQISTTTDVDVLSRTATKTIATVSSGFAADYYCDGADDDVQINAAITAVGALGGGKVLIRTGSYNINSTVDFDDYVMLEGEGFGTILVYAHVTGSQYMLRANGVTGVQIRNMQIDGANLTGTNPRNLVLLQNATTGSIVENLYIHDAPDSAIVLDQATCQHNIVRSNIIDTTGDIGIYVSVANNNVIVNNVILNTASYGIRNVNSGAAKNTYVGNYVYNCGQTLGADGIRILNGDSCIVANNTVVASGQNGIYVGSPYVSITGNTVVDSDEVGIYCDSSAGRCQISGNTVHNSSRASSGTYAGILLNGSVEVAVTGNRSGDTGAGTRQKYGIQENGAADDNVIVGNMLKRNSTAGLLTVGASTVVGSNLE
jgi:parallel beta-helix repeat protein